MLGAAILLAGVFEGIGRVSSPFLKDRLDPLYAVAREVRKGMPRAEVLRVMETHRADFVARAELPEGDLVLRVMYSLTDTCSTYLFFKGGALESTRTIGEDSPEDHCPNAPPDIR